MKVCIIIPMYNEEAIALFSLETILFYVERLSITTTLLVVNDGSKDRTEEIVKKFISKQNNKILELINQQNKGYGGALRTGIKFAIDNNFDYVLFMDSDLTNHPKYLKDFYKKIDEGFEYIKATRYSLGGGYENVPFKRRFIGKLGNLFGKLITGLPIYDLTNGFRAVNVNLFKKIDLSEDHFAIIIEELMKITRITNKITEIPVILTNRSGEARKTAFTYDARTFWRYFKYFFYSK